MRRLVSAALLGALAFAGSAAAAVPPVPYVHSTVVGGHRPVRATASITPPVQLFGDTVTATVVVLADRKWIDPSRLRPVVDFAPYAEIKPPTKHQSEHGRLVEMEWTWTLRCLTAACVPVVPPSDLRHVFRFPLARIQVVGANGKVEYSAGARFPALEVLSEISPGIVAFLHENKALKWQYQLAPPAVAYRFSPGLVFWAALLLACVCAAAGLTIATRWAMRFRSAAPVVAAGPPLSSLERALALFFWAGRRGDETLQRKALERVAAELPLDVAGLSDATRELAWSPETPEEDEVEAISEQAGVPAHHGDGTGG